MIFIAKNEDGISSWKLVLDKKKTVTRRIKPLPVGKVFAVQPGRGKFAVCKAKVISCINSLDHWNNFIDKTTINIYQTNEARLEGFNTWYGLIKFFQKRNIKIKDTFRIEFEIIKE